MVTLSARMAKNHWLLSILRKRTVTMELNSLNLHQPLGPHQRRRKWLHLATLNASHKVLPHRSLLIAICNRKVFTQYFILLVICYVATCSIQDCCQSKTLWQRRWSTWKLTSLLKLLAWRHRGQDINTDYRIL